MNWQQIYYYDSSVLEIKQAITNAQMEYYKWI